MDKRKLFVWGSGAVLLLMYWGLFAAFTNWWLGLIGAAIVFGLQTWVQYSIRIGDDEYWR